jgi:hypothetical protein
MRTTFLTLPLLLATLPAQDQAPPFRFVAADAIAVVRVAAPAKWRQQFATTQVAKLMEAATLAPLLGQAGAMMDAAMAELKQSGKVDAELVQKLLSDYRGDITLSFHVDAEQLREAIDQPDPPPFQVVLALAPDGAFDLGALAKEIARAVDAESEGRRPLREMTLGEHRFQVTDDEDMPATVPTMIDGHLVMLLGQELEQRAPRLLAADDRFAGAAGDRPLFMHGRLGGLMAAIGQGLAEQAESGEVPFDASLIMRNMGLLQLDQLTLQVGADGKRVDASLELAMSEGERGLVGAVLGNSTGTPQLLRLVPPSCESFAVGGIDLRGIYRTIATIWGELGEMVPMTWDDAKAGFAETMKVRLEEDLIDHLGDQMLNITDPGDTARLDDEDGPLAMLTGQVVALSLRNGKAFGAALETMLRARGLHASRKTEEYEGIPVHNLRLAGLLQVEYVVTDDLLILSLGASEAAQKSLRAVLDARSNPAAAGEVPAAAKPLVEGMPSGWSSLSIVPVAELMQTLGSVFEAQSEMMEDLAMPAQVMKGVSGDMRRLGLQTIGSAGYPTAKGWRWQMRW